MADSVAADVLLALAFKYALCVVLRAEVAADAADELGRQEWQCELVLLTTKLALAERSIMTGCEEWCWLRVSKS